MPILMLRGSDSIVRSPEDYFTSLSRDLFGQDPQLFVA